MDRIRQWLAHEAAGGVALMLAALVAVLLANSPAKPFVDAVLGAEIAVTVNGHGLTQDVLTWINDGLMAVFFFLIGLELKYEMVAGRLRNPRDVILPGVAALGGMALPALVYLGVITLGRGDAGLTNGWAIPTATDIAFAMGVLALVGRGLPPSLKTFLLTLAILDDLGAILVIAIFYGHGLHVEWLAAALLPLAGMLGLMWMKVRAMGPSLFLALILWAMILSSGIHATVAGVIAAFCIPIKDRDGGSPLHALEEALGPYVTFLIVPIFALANAGLVMPGLSSLLHPLSLAIGAGLVIGKPLGVMAAVIVLSRLGIARPPEGASPRQVWGIACLAGIGFTMSLFIGGLAFGMGKEMNEVRIGVLAGSLVSAVLGGVLLRLPSGQSRQKPL
jgi:NhaA family Na+:H+ antiporter